VPFGFPRLSLGTTRTRGLLRNRLTLPDLAGVRTYSTPLSSTNHKGVETAAPLFLYVTRLRYFRLENCISFSTFVITFLRHRS
jgi:hypothetical protein